MEKIIGSTDAVRRLGPITATACCCQLASSARAGGAGWPQHDHSGVFAEGVEFPKRLRYPEMNPNLHCWKFRKMGQKNHKQADKNMKAMEAAPQFLLLFFYYFVSSTKSDEDHLRFFP